MLICCKKISLAPLAGDCCDKSHQFSRSLALARNSKKQQQKETERNSNGPRQENDVGIEAKKITII